MSNAPQSADFETVVMPHLDAVYRMARRLARVPADAEDLVQETYLRAFRAFESFQLRDYGARPWLMKILHNCFYSRVGRESKAPALIEDSSFDDFAGGDGPAPDGKTDAGEIDWDLFDEEIKNAIGELPAEFSEPLVLWAMEELSYKEIAEVCDVPIGTVMSRLHRARKLLHDHLADYAKHFNTVGVDR